MNSPSALPPPPLPRLRVSRTPRTNIDSPHSGSSRLSDPIASNSVEFNVDNEPSRNLLSSMSFSMMDASATLPETTAADRLRAVMARLPPSSSSDATPTPPSPSERESDFDQPHFGSSTASVAQESIRSIFSRARRDPGDTPQRDNRPRRNSFDSTEVEAKPRAQTVKQERAGNIGRRQSMSDEEIERHSHRSDLSDDDVFSVHSKTPRAFGSSRDSRNDSIDTQAMVNDLGNSQTTPPAATSTPQHSLQMSLNSYLQAQSNLLDNDSEMQRGLQDFNSDGGESPNVRLVPVPFSSASRKKQVVPQGTIRPRPADRSKAHSGTSRSLVDLKNSQSFSIPKPDPRKARASHSSSRLTDLSHNNYVHSFPKGHSGLTRQDSMNSVSSDGATSEGSYADHQERMAGSQSEHSDNLERQWNKPHPRAPSSLSQSSADAIRLSRSGGGHQRHNSFSNSRSTSPASSRTSIDEEREREQEVQAEVDHERERNWNSPHPTWYNQPTHHNHSSRANSPMPLSPTTSPPSDSPYKGIRPRVDSNVSARGTPSALKVPDSPSRSRVRPTSHSSRSNSPSLPDSTAPRSTSSRYSHSNASISPTHSNNNEDRPRSRSTSKSAPSDASQRTKFASRPPPSPAPSTPNPIKHKSSGHSRPSSSSKGKSRVVDRDKPISNQTAERSSVYDGQSTDTDGEDLPQESTPTLKTTTLVQPQTEERRTPSPQLWSQTIQDDPHSYRRTDGPDTPPPSSPLSQPSTPPTPPSSEPLFAAHHRRSSFSQHEYQTISPPKGLPELPGPPSSGSEDEQDTEPVGQVTLLKTPRPPGAWAHTPAPRLARSNSLPVDEESLQDGGQASPENSTPLARTTSLPPQTPAPPGGWLMTPKKSVRFDPPLAESDGSGADITPNSSMVFYDEPTRNEQRSSRTTKENGILKPSSVLNTDNNIPDIQPTPISPSKSRRMPTVNFVDEYGQEQKPDTSHASPRNRSAIRIVDAMGREVDDSTVSLEEPLTRTEAVTRMRQGLSQIAQDLEDVFQSSSDIDMARLAELEQASRASRNKREVLARKLHNADEEVKRKVVSLRESMNKSKTLVSAAVGRRCRCPSLSWIALAIIVQLFVVFIMYLISVSHARHLFLTTYYDPIYAELHMYTTKPDYTINWLDSPPMSEGGDRFITRVLNMFADWRDTGEQNRLWPPT
ncbi:hypothetical protein IW261DRAFT_1421368 [Armillaria novae-zelandiae]|uniref:Uncharacterized protein n=1 Tax=Armillaria novae-zelandiae TaxID=153914 RepID=A0AA39P2Z6_9AGAR|nr:hypothetical protein IW261DRAFT_1421368 [Armillaria novae-zelandiae]